MVAQSITVREVMGKALQGVGGAHSTTDPGDSTTPEKGRALLVCMSIGMS